MSKLVPSYARLDVDLVIGKGAYAYDKHGTQYLDFCSGIAVNALGHCHPDLVHTIREQSEKIWQTSNIFSSEMAEQAAKRICDTTHFGERVFFCNSGAEALEGTIKTIRKYFYDQGKPHKNEIITMSGAFHGRTMATICAANKGTEGFAPLLGGFKQAIFNDLESVRACITHNTAGILLEPIQGEGGVIKATPEFLKGVESLARDNNILLALDEVQSGACRTGAIWAHQLYDITPDIMAIAKGIGGGFPVGAFVMRADLATAMGVGTHGSTYGGNPMAMAIVNTMFKHFSDPEFLKHIHTIAHYFNEKLTALSNRYTIRQQGLFIALQFANDINNADMYKTLIKNRLLCVRGGENTIRLLPPLNITHTHVDEAIEKLNKALQDI